jgi:hypothetical protein
MKLNKFVISTISSRAYICEHGPARQCDGAQGRSRCRQCNLLSFLSQSCMNVCDLVEHSPHREIHRLIILCNILQGGIFYQRSSLVVKKYWKQVSNKRERYLFTLFFTFIPGCRVEEVQPDGLYIHHRIYKSIRVKIVWLKFQLPRAIGHYATVLVHRSKKEVSKPMYKAAVFSAV